MFNYIHILNKYIHKDSITHMHTHYIYIYTHIYTYMYVYTHRHIHAIYFPFHKLSKKDF